MCGLCADDGWMAQDSTSDVSVKFREVWQRARACASATEYSLDPQKRLDIEESRRSGLYSEILGVAVGAKDGGVDWGMTSWGS